MTAFRVTQGTLSALTIDGLQDNLGRLQQLQEQLSTGRQVNRPSDNPSDAVAALRYRSDVRRNQQYSRNADDGMAWLGMADSTLTGMLDSTRRARDLVLQGSNGTLSAQDRSALADEVDTIRQGLLSSANTQYLGRPIFGGTTTGGQAFDATTGAYVGDNGAVVRNVAPNTPVQVNLNGPAVFGPAGGSLFDVLGTISADLRNPANTANLASTDLAQLDGAIGTMTNSLSEVGARYNRVQDMKTKAESTLGTLQTGLSNVEDIDLPKTITDLELQKTAYQAALSASAKMIQPSLVDFLK